MIKKISKIMWAIVLGLFIFSVVVGGVTNNDTLAYMTGKLVGFTVIVQIILLIIGFFTKNKEN